MVGCGDSNTLSERTGTTPTPTASGDEENYVIKPVTQILTTRQKEILKIHNERRSNDFSDSDLSYSIELETAAQTYADKLAKNGKQEHDPSNKINGYGENIFAHSANKNIALETAMRQWYDNEKKIYTYETNECNTSRVSLRNDADATCGHYTQVAWQNTKEVGCATTTYTNLTSSYFGGAVYICKYTKAGNVVNEKPYCTNYVTNDIYTGTIPTINTTDITAKNLVIELVAEDRVNCSRTDNQNGSISFAQGFQSAQLIDFDIFNGNAYTVTLNFDKVEIINNMVKLTGTGLATEKYPIFMNIKFVGEADTYYGVELEWNGHNEANTTLSRSMKAKLYK